MPATVQAKVRKAVVDALAALFETAGEYDVRVSYAYEPARNDRERIFTSRASGETPPAAIKSGRNVRDESATFEVVVLVGGVGEDAFWCDERAAALGLVFEEWLADNKSGEALAVPGLQWIRADRWESNNLANDRGNLSELTYTVRYHARLT